MELLKMLMLLFHLGCRQGSQTTELLTVKYYNTASRLQELMRLFRPAKATDHDAYIRSY